MRISDSTAILNAIYAKTGMITYWIGYYEKDTEIAKFEDVIKNNLKEYTFPILKCNNFGHNCEKYSRRNMFQD